MIENSCTNPARDYLWHYKHQKTVRIRRQRRFTAQKSPVRCPPNNRPQPVTLRLRPSRGPGPSPSTPPPPRLFLPPAPVIWHERARGPKQIIIMPPQEQERRERGGRECHLQPINSNSVQFSRPPRNQRVGLGPCGGEAICIWRGGSRRREFLHTADRPRRCEIISVAQGCATTPLSPAFKFPRHRTLGPAAAHSVSDLSD